MRLQIMPTILQWLAESPSDAHPSDSATTLPKLVRPHAQPKCTATQPQEHARTVHPLVQFVSACWTAHPASQLQSSHLKMTCAMPTVAPRNSTTMQANATTIAQLAHTWTTQMLTAWPATQFVWHALAAPWTAQAVTEHSNMVILVFHNVPQGITDYLTDAWPVVLRFPAALIPWHSPQPLQLRTISRSSWLNSINKPTSSQNHKISWKLTSRWPEGCWRMLLT